MESEENKKEKKEKKSKKSLRKTPSKLGLENETNDKEGEKKPPLKRKNSHKRSQSLNVSVTSVLEESKQLNEQRPRELLSAHRKSVKEVPKISLENIPDDKEVQIPKTNKEKLTTKKPSTESFFKPLPTVGEANYYSTFEGRHFLKFLKDDNFSDVILISESGQSVKCHKLILSYSSEFFLKLFRTNPLSHNFHLQFEFGQSFDAILTFLYGGEITITESNAVELMLLSTLLSISTLKIRVAQYLSTKIRRENALKVLKHALKANLAEVISKCIFALAKNFCCYPESDTKEFSVLPHALFLQLLQHEYFNVRDEMEVFKVVDHYVQVNRNYLTIEMIDELFSEVRYRFFGYKQLLELSKNPIIPRDVLLDATLVRLAEHETPHEIDKQLLQLPRMQARKRHPITMEFSDERKGVFYWIGTNGEKEVWQNPATRSAKVTSSGTERGQPIDLVRKLDNVELWTKDVPSSWFCLDLGPTRKLLINYYTLMHGGNYTNDILRTWNLQGSNDGENWSILKRHVNDPSLVGKFEAYSWPVDGAVVPYRYFRILQTGHNSSKRNFLVLSGVEMYGELYEE